MSESTAKTTKTKKSKLFPNEPMMTINIPMTRYETDDVWVAVNGKSMQIKRGVDVEVPRCIALALEDSQKMLIKAIENQAALADQADASELN